MNYTGNYNKQLQSLLRLLNDSKQGYTEATELVQSAELKDLFFQIIKQRETLAAEIRDRIHSYGGTPDEERSDLMASLHRGWMEIKTSMTKKDDQAVLESCRNGDQTVLDAYDDILQGDLLNDTDIKTFLMSQRFIINETFTELDRRYFSLFKKDPSI